MSRSNWFTGVGILFFFPNRTTTPLIQLTSVLSPESRSWRIEHRLVAVFSHNSIREVSRPTGDDIEDTLKVDDYVVGDVLWIHPVKSGVMSCNFTYKTFQSESNDRYDTPYFVLVGEKEFIHIG